MRGVTVDSNGDVTFLGDPITKKDVLYACKALASYIGLTGDFTHELTLLSTDLANYRAKQTEDLWNIVVARTNIFKEFVYNFQRVSDTIVETILGEGDAAAPKRNESRERVCPMSFASAKPRKCNEDCAWFVTPEGWDEGCCAIAAAATCIRNIDDGLNGEGIYSELNAISCTLQNANATP